MNSIVYGLILPSLQ